jgi:ADP-ribose pyrophosphatase YjhB (NUDIX family)
MFTFCPNCGSRNIRFSQGRLYDCPDCGLHYYENVAAASGLLIDTPKGLILERRVKEPRAGFLTLPGGFVNIGEGVLDGARRECREELGFDPGAGLRFLASFPNTYPYRGQVYQTCDCYFCVKLDAMPRLKIDLTETSRVVFVRPSNIALEDIAFESTRNAIRAYTACLFSCSAV